MKTRITQLTEMIANCNVQLAAIEARVETTATGERCQQYEIEAYRNMIATAQKERDRLASKLFS